MTGQSHVHDPLLDSTDYKPYKPSRLNEPTLEMLEERARKSLTGGVVDLEILLKRYGMIQPPHSWIIMPVVQLLEALRNRTKADPMGAQKWWDEEALPRIRELLPK